MSVDNEIVVNLIITVFFFFIIYFLFYRKYVLSIIDPLVFHISNCAFSSVLVINSIQDPQYMIHFFICQLFLALGFIFIQKYLVVNNSISNIHCCFYDLTLFKYTVYISFIIFLLANFTILYFKGFALLSDDPTTAKVTNFQGGFGIFRKINWGIGSFVSAGLLILFLIEGKRVYILLLAIFGLFIALEGSKSSLMRIILVAVLLINHPYFSGNKIIVDRLKKYVPLGFIAIAIVLYTAFSKTTNDFTQIAFIFIQRLLYGADSILYFYQPANEYLLTQYGPLDFIHHITNPVLSFLRISTYDEALGNIMVENAIPPGVTMDVIVGPNSPFYIEGQVYFGYYGAFAYSFFIGGVYSCIRKVFFSLARGSYFLLALCCALCFHGSNVLIESTLFITTCFDTCFFVVPIYITVCLLFNGKLVIRLVSFNRVT